MKALVLDCEALSLLADGRTDSREVMAAVTAAVNQRRPVITPAVVLAELYRTQSRVAAVNSMLQRNKSAITIRDTDMAFARYVGTVLSGANADSTDMVDAHCVAAAAEFGGGVIMTSDVGDIERLSAPYANVVAAKV